MTMQTYSREELRAMIDKMHAASNAFYGAAIEIGNHAFVEFTGLLNEYITLCEKALANGQDFAVANTHSGESLPMQPHHVMYLGEKLNCIYGAALRDPKLGRVFVSTVLGDSQLDDGDGARS